MSKPSGTVYLCKNALVDRTYSHTIDFKNPDEQQAYWGSLVSKKIENVTYTRNQRQYIRVDIPLDQLKDINYLFYRAEEDAKLYYCWVDDKEYFNDNTTSIYFDVDVLQTYMFDYKVLQSYVLQEHEDRWDANHKPIYSRTEENLDYGTEYTVESAYNIKPNNDIEWYLAVCTEHSSQITGGWKDMQASRITDVVTPYYYYLLPQSRNNTETVGNSNSFTLYSSFVDGGSNGHIVRGVRSFMEHMARSEFGNYVQQIVKIPYLPFKYKFDNVQHVLDFTVLENIGIHYSTMASPYTGPDASVSFIRLVETNSKISQLLAEMGVFEGISSAMPTAEQWAEVKANPYNTERDKRFESKLLCYPYRFNLLTDWRSQPMIVKNEYIGGDKIKVGFTQSTSFNGACRYWVENYKKDPQGRTTSLMQLTQDEAPVVKDAYYSYMLQNKNQISANQTNAIVNATANTIGSIATGLIGGNIIGGVMGGVSGALSGAINYQNMIRSENAKQRDIKNLPDTIINSNDGAFNSQDKNIYLTFYRYKICCEFEQLLADTFAMTGYTVKRMKVPNLKTRVRYNYVKTLGVNIVGSFNQDALTLIRQIFDNGVTFWHYNTVNFKPLDYSLENIETKLL